MVGAPPLHPVHPRATRRCSPRRAAFPPAAPSSWAAVAARGCTSTRARRSRGTGRGRRHPSRGRWARRCGPRRAAAGAAARLDGHRRRQLVHLVPALGRHHRVVSVDHRGHGRGVRTRRRFRLEDCADDVVAVADRLGIDRFVPVGYSMGGPIAQLVWRRHPGRVAGLVLCATSRSFRERPAERALFPLLAGLSMAARLAPAGVRSRVGDRMAIERFDDSPVGRWATGEVRRNDPRMVVEAGHAIGRFSSTEWIGDVDVPTAVLVTEHDAVVPPHRQRTLAAAIPGADVYPVPGDHGVCLLQPRVFVPVLAAACRAVSDEAIARRRHLDG
ncbi:MAG: alpha/beta fold hydrolase [Acidimicrobiales bacterium]